MKEVNFVGIRCICGASSTDATNIGEKDGLVVAQCNSCGIIRTPYTIANYEEFYTEGDTYHAERDGQIPYRDRFYHDRKVAEMRLKKFAQVSKPRWLDVGCANGGFMAETHEQGKYRVEGLELNPHMAQWARNKTGLRVHTSWDTVQGQFDVISLHDVLEHVPDPYEMLRIIRNSLVLDGYVIIDCPDAEHERFAADPMTSHHMKPKEHLWFFRQADLEMLLTKMGFAVHAVDRPIPGKIVIYGRPV